MTASKIRAAILSECDGTFEGSVPCFTPGDTPDAVIQRAEGVVFIVLKDLVLSGKITQEQSDIVQKEIGL